MSAPKGHRVKNAPNGRKRGNPKKFTVTAKKAMEMTFEGIGGVDGFIAWAGKNRGEFYKLYARLIPADLRLVGAPLVNITLPSGPIITLEAAQLVYDTMLRDPSQTGEGLVFDMPQPEVVAVVEAMPEGSDIEVGK